MCGERRTQRGRGVVVSLLIPREIHFLGPSGRIWRGYPLVVQHGDATEEVMIQVGSALTHTDIDLGYHINGWVGESNME